jgi:PmbA protein
MKIDPCLAEEIVSKALKGGIDQVEVFVKSVKNLSLEIKDQAVDSMNASQGFGYAVRIIKDGRYGFSYSTALEDADSVIRNALETAKYADKDEYLDLPGPAGVADIEIFDPAINEISEGDAIGNVRLLERSVYETDSRIRKVRKALGSFTVSEAWIVNSKYVEVGYVSTSCSAQIMAIAEEGEESRIGWDFDASRFLRDISFENIGRNAAANALRLLGSRKIKGGKAHVILDNAVSVEFLGIFAPSLSSEAVQKGKSLLSGRLGKKVISEKINMIDSGILSGRLGSRPFDDEGVPQKEKMVIANGVLMTYLYNTYSARKDGTLSTGNAVRSGFSSAPSVGVTNLLIEAVSKSDIVPKERLFGSIGRGLYVVDAMGVHTANPITGDFSVGVSGIWIENGNMKHPVKEVVISGNILEFFDRIEAIGDDLRFYGNIGAPSLIIPDVDISA